jgi:hypothetical protein
MLSTVARWYISKPKILIWIHTYIFEGLGMENIGILYGHLKCFIAP